jgi:hypothetical protein
MNVHGSMHFCWARKRQGAAEPRVYQGNAQGTVDSHIFMVKGKSEETLGLKCRGRTTEHFGEAVGVGLKGGIVSGPAAEICLNLAQVGFSRHAESRI